MSRPFARRKTYEPDPVAAAILAELGGADSITIHLREDRRHIQDRDLRLLRETVPIKLNLELSVADEIVGIACQVKPDQATIVPERREEVTTEGGLDVLAHRAATTRAIERLRGAGISVSLFLDPEQRQIELARQLGADAVELHTGQYALARGARSTTQLVALTNAGKLICELGMNLHAGHGLNYHNVTPRSSHRPDARAEYRARNRGSSRPCRPGAGRTGNETVNPVTIDLLTCARIEHVILAASRSRLLSRPARFG